MYEDQQDQKWDQRIVSPWIVFTKLMISFFKKNLNKNLKSFTRLLNN